MEIEKVFIIGAGASNEAGLPTGEKLKDIIIGLLDFKFDNITPRLVSGDECIWSSILNEINKSSSKRNDREKLAYKYIDIAKALRNALIQAVSIDNYLHEMRDSEDRNALIFLSKLAISQAILKSENDSKLKTNTSKETKLDFQQLDGTWYSSFFKLIKAGCCINDLYDRLSEIVLVVFNYDRCIEQYLFYAFQNYYNIDQRAAAKLVGLINIYHPYGVVGHLPWSLSETEMKVHFGAAPSVDTLITLSNGIKTFTEENTSDQINEIRLRVADAKQMIFLGFHFHPLNMKLITPSYEPNKVYAPHVFGTAYQMSETNKLASRDQILDFLHGAEVSEEFVQLTDAKCNDFFNESWKAIEFKE